jgi:predicted permease
MLFTSVAALATNLLFGGITAWPAARVRLSEVLKESTRTTSGRSWIRQGLLVAQASFSMVLLVGAGLLIMTLISLTRVDLGFDTEGLIAVRLPSKPSGYETSQNLWDFEQSVLRYFEGSHVINSIAGSSSLPLERGINTPMSIAGRPDATGTVEWRAVTPNYFQTLGMELRTGRSFEATDDAGNALVVIVNDSFARRYFPNENPIGHRIEIGRSRNGFIEPSLANTGAEIVGIVADIREVSIRAEPRRTIYVPQAQAASRLSNIRGTMPVFIARAQLTGGNVERALAQAFRAVDPALPRPQAFPLNDVVVRSLARERFGAALLSVLAALALMLTAFGIYSVIAYSVQQRRPEIGIRMALGAAGRQVMRLIIVQGIVPVLGGVLLGVGVSIGLSSVLTEFLFGVTSTDFTTLVAAAAVLVGVALVASWIPARQAATMDPLKTLNSR